MTNTTPFWGTLPQWFSAGAACIALIIAGVASTTWRATLKGKRGDDLLAAVFDFAGNVGATKSVVERQASEKSYGAQVDRMFVSLLSLEKAHIVAMRSYKELDENKIVPLQRWSEEL